MEADQGTLVVLFLCSIVTYLQIDILVLNGGNTMNKVKTISLILCLSILVNPVSVMASDWGLDIESANDAFGEMAGEFNKQRRNFGNIEIYEKSEIYDRYNAEIKQNKVILDADKKLADFKNHEYEGYGTIGELNKKLSDQFKKGAEDNDSNFADKLNESKEKDDFISSIKNDLSEKKEEIIDKTKDLKGNKTAVSQQSRYQSMKDSFASIVSAQQDDSSESMPQTDSGGKRNSSGLVSFEELVKSLPGYEDEDEEKNIVAKYESVGYQYIQKNPLLRTAMDTYNMGKDMITNAVDKYNKE